MSQEVQRLALRSQYLHTKLNLESFKQLLTITRADRNEYQSKKSRIIIERLTARQYEVIPQRTAICRKIDNNR